MGATIEFYAGDPAALARCYDIEDIDQHLACRSGFPMADFSFHLAPFEDLDSLLQCLKAEGLNLPDEFEELMVEELWSDGDEWIPATLHRLDDRLTAVARLDDAAHRRVAARWWPEWQGEEHIPEALAALSEVARQAEQPGWELMFYLYPG
ncbi:MAG: hypothetical protein KC910_21580 [Candidatus Eremiobacteraeota bacterium]|nr:hypothetical protein [Candidatus Eremiobacteraeota bacterium]